MTDTSARSRPSPVARWIRSLPQWLYVTIIVAVVALLLLITVLVNPGDRIGPVQPASPPVGGPGLPPARL
ncbi:hypothetical protein [Aquihabitans sp. McL0605]|uniref:hypothetical protein n=1 Tax=Aquihabitans sp. McL0605 TaxID=3415671 RepID=UPI003CE6A0FF